MGHGSSQIFTDKLVWVHLTAEGVVQHSLQEEISLFFFRRRRWASLVFESVCICENLCPRFRICFEFPISIFELPSVSHRIGITYLGPPPEVEGLYQTNCVRRIKILRTLCDIRFGVQFTGPNQVAKHCNRLGHTFSQWFVRNGPNGSF